MLHLMPRPCNVKVSLQEENQPFHDKVPDRLFVVDQVHKFINRRVLFLFPLVVVVFGFFLNFLFIYFWLCWVFIFCARAFSSCGERGLLFIAVRGPLTIVASLVVERRLSSCGSRAQLLRGMWDLPRPRLEPVSPALAGGFLTTAPPGKPQWLLFLHSRRDMQTGYTIPKFSATMVL